MNMPKERQSVRLNQSTRLESAPPIPLQFFILATKFMITCDIKVG